MIANKSQIFTFIFLVFSKHPFADKKNSYFCNISAGIAQLVEHNPPTGGFGPHSSLKNYYNAGIAQLVEHNLAKVRVAGSSPVSRSHPPNPPVGEEAGFFIS